MKQRARMLAWLLLALSAPLAAQDPFDADALDADAFELDDAAPSAWQPFAELRLRGDHVQGLPNNREDIDRARLRARGGWRFTASERWSATVALEAALGSDDNRDRFLNNDNERSDDLNLDQAWFEWQPDDALRLQAGKMPLPMQLSPLLWDDDLRPTGAAVDIGGVRGLTHRWQLQAGGFAPDPLELGGARVAIVQAGWHWNEGARWGGGALLSHLRFSRIDTLARAGVVRGNLAANGHYVNDYRPVDLQLFLRRNDERWPLLVSVDVAHNPGADTRRNGARLSAVLGDRRRAGQWEFGWAWERIQRDLTLAAVTEDDWWFHSRLRGHMPWIGAGIDATWSWRLAAFSEIRDAPREHTRRVLLDLEARW